MKILIVKLSPVESNDSANIRTIGLAKGLIELNHSIDYLTIPVSNYHSIMSEKDILGLMNIVRTSSNSVYDAATSGGGRFKKAIVGLMRKIYHLFSLYDYTYSIAKKIDISLINNTEYDIVISSSDPKTSHITVQYLIKQGLKYKKWIQYWGDPMTMDITNKSLYPKWFKSKVEEKLLSLADRIVYVSPFTLEEQKKIFPKLFDKMVFFPTPYIDEKEYEETNNTKFTVGYFGAYHSKIRNIMPLYNACIDMKECICLTIVGDSDLSLQHTESIKTYPRGDVSEFEKKADLLVCLLNKKGLQIPGKIYHSAGTNKPILVVLDGENREQMKHYLDSFGRFIVCENTEKSIEEAIQNIIAIKTRYKPAHQFTPNTIASNFIDLMKET